MEKDKRDMLSYEIIADSDNAKRKYSSKIDTELKAFDKNYINKRNLGEETLDVDELFMELTTLRAEHGMNRVSKVAISDYIENEMELPNMGICMLTGDPCSKNFVIEIKDMYNNIGYKIKIPIKGKIVTGAGAVTDAYVEDIAGVGKFKVEKYALKAERVNIGTGK